MNFIPAAKGNYTVQIIDARSSALKWISLGCSSSPGEQPCSTPLQALEILSYFQLELTHSHFIPISSGAKAVLQFFLCPSLSVSAQKEHILCQPLLHERKSLGSLPRAPWGPLCECDEKEKKEEVTAHQDRWSIQTKLCNNIVKRPCFC